MEAITDQYGRTFRTLRVSLTSRCNFGCVYCVAGDEAGPVMREQALGAAELLGMIGRLHGRLGLETVRLTGGEPLLYPELVALLEGLRMMAIRRIKPTTNGSLLDRKAV